MKVYSTDLRRRVLAACDQGHGTKEVAQMFDVAPSWVLRLKQRRREDGTIEPRPSGGDRSSSFVGASLDGLMRMVGQKPDATLEELRDRSAAELGVACSVMSVFRATLALRLSFKKSRSTPPNRTAPTSAKAASDGSGRRRRSIRTGSSSSTNRAPKRT